MFKKTIFFFSIIALTALISCSKYQKLLKSTDNEKKYEAAMELYEKGDYYRALQLFDQLIPVYRGTNKAEMLYFYYADSYYNEHEYIMASYYYKRFASSFPTSDYAEEASFMAAYCKYLDSPRPSLDQTTTREAIEEFQLFINRYPMGERAESANELIDELVHKLQEKSYDIANLYFQMEDYRAAIVSYENLIRDYPDTEYKEDALYKIIKSYYEYALKSIEEKKKERYGAAAKNYFDFVALYPLSPFIDEVEKMNLRIQNALEYFETHEQQ